MISYVKLWFLLKERGMKRTDLLEVISSATLAKLGKNEMVSLSVIEKICDYLCFDVLYNRRSGTKLGYKHVA